MGSFAAHTRFLDAAETRLTRGQDAFVDADHADFQTTSHSEDLRKIARIEVSGQSDASVIRQCNDVFFGGESVREGGSISRIRLETEMVPLNSRHRTENLCIGDLHILTHVGQ